MSRNRISRISSKFFGNFPRLEILDLSFNLLESLDSRFEELTSLKTLSVVGNRINKIPKFISEMKSLTNLEIEWAFFVSNSNTFSSKNDLNDILQDSMNIPTTSLRLYFSEQDLTNTIDFFDFTTKFSIRQDFLHKNIKDIMLTSIRLEFSGLFDTIFYYSPVKLKTSKEFILTALKTSLQVYNFQSAMTIIHHIDQKNLHYVYGDHGNPLHFALHNW